jgi:hypothetical protein
MRNLPIVFGRCSVLLLAFICCGASANVCRVTTSGANVHDGSTWSVPMDLQTALGTPACTEIWIAAGTYTPGGSYTVGKKGP